MASHRLHRDDHSELGGQLRGVDAGGVDDGVCGQGATRGEADGADHGAGLFEAGHPVGEEGDPGGRGLVAEHGEEHLGVEPAVADRQHPGDEVVADQTRVTGGEIGMLEPLSINVAFLVGRVVAGQSVDVIGADDEQVPVGAPAQIRRRGAVDRAPRRPVLDRLEGVLRHQDVLRTGEQLPDTAGALPGGGLGVAVVGFDDNHLQAGLGLLQVQCGRAADRSCADDDNRAHVLLGPL